jgi:hypothetical protein
MRRSPSQETPHPRRHGLARTVLLGAGGGACSVGIWLVWLGLGLLLGTLATIALTHEISLPDFVLRRIEARMVDAGLRLTCTRISLDPTGRILVRDPALAPVEQEEPVLRARSAYARLNPWELAAGRVEFSEIRFDSASLVVPPMLSGTGRAEEIVRDLAVTVRTSGASLVIAECTGRVANAAVSLHGSLPLPRLPEGGRGGSVAAFMRERFATVCRQAVAATEKAAALQQALIDLEFVETPRGVELSVAIQGSSLSVSGPISLELQGLRFNTRIATNQSGTLPLQANLQIAQARIDGNLPGVAREIIATLAGQLQTERLDFQIEHLELSSASVEAAGVQAGPLSAHLVPGPNHTLVATLATRLAGEPLSLLAHAQLDNRSGAAEFSGRLSPSLLDAIERRTAVNVKRFFDFDRLDCLAGEAQFGPGVKLQGLTAHAALSGVRAYGVNFDEGRATVTFDGQRFFVPEVYGRVGSNFARGSYEHELGSHRYRFLLTGELRPLDISPWFGPWWGNFFRDYDFAAAAPAAEVDIQGQWRQGHRTNLFISAAVDRPVVRGGSFDHVRTRLFIRPHFFDGLELFATHDSGAARGTFLLENDPVTRSWKSLDLDAEATMPLDLVRRVIGPVGENVLSPFEAAEPPEAKVTLHFDGPAAPGGRHVHGLIVARTSGEFRLSQFPLSDVSFRAAIRDDEIQVDDVVARFAGGTATGHVRLWGEGAQRRVGFDLALKGAQLGEAAAALNQFIALRRKKPMTPASRFVQEKAGVRIDVAASAEGSFGDLLTFRGDGNAALEGQELGEVPLLGGLSELLKFTALRFTSARANFKIDGPRLVFSEVAIRGANSAIDGRGAYLMDRNELDFTAKIFPFQESDSLLKSVVGAVLTPFSNVFEVKLGGQLDKPAWSLNLLHSPTPEQKEPAPTSPNPSPTTTKTAARPNG